MARFTRILMFFAVAVELLGCGSRVPSAADFKLPAVGTPMPGGHEEALKPNLAPAQSGALVINQTGLSVQVAVSNTIATLPVGQDFLFVLPPAAYEFYIYEPNSAPRIHKETLENGKLRYIYLTRVVPGGG